MRKDWPSWGDVLSVCLGDDPLAMPPGGDTGAFRKLQWDGRSGHWMLELSGLNRCSMKGVVALRVKKDVVDASGLVVDGVPWGEGGQFRGKQILRGELRDAALLHWTELPPEEQLRTLRSLRADPDATETLEELERLYGPLTP